MNRFDRQITATVNQVRGQVIVSGVGVQDLMAVMEARYRTLGSGAVVIDVAEIGALEVACAATNRPLRIQSKRVVGP